MALKKSELYSSLWSSCDELRGGMDASQYKDYVLVMLFIKYVSDRYAGQAEDTPETLDTPGKRALYNNLKKDAGMPAGADGVAEQAGEYGSTMDLVLNLALKIDETVKQVRPDGWRGVQARERVIKAALYGILQDVAEVERVFLIIKAQKEY